MDQKTYTHTDVLYIEISSKAVSVIYNSQEQGYLISFEIFVKLRLEVITK